MAGMTRIACCILLLALFGSVQSAIAPPSGFSLSSPPSPGGGGGGDDYSTSVSDELNTLMGKTDTDTYGRTYNGGYNRGLIFRTPDFEDSYIVAATFLHNDIITPSPVYTGPCSPKTPYAFEAPVVGVVLGEAGMSNLFYDFDNIQDEDWDFGVFYPTDSNSADQRCIWNLDFDVDGQTPPRGGFDCSPNPDTGDHYAIYPDGTNPEAVVCTNPEDCLGPGEYAMGNPLTLGFDQGGGGVGCHFDLPNTKKINQQDVYEQGCAGQDGCPNLTSDVWCQCNYDLYYQDGYGIDYGAWVDQWIYGDVAGIYPDKEYGFNAPGNTQNAPSFYLDQSICWMSNPRDMIMLQNAIWLRRYEWSACASGGTSQNCEPETDFYATSSDNPSQFDINSQRIYWGWNEVPVAQDTAKDASNWESFAIVLPTGVDSANYLDADRMAMIDCQINAQVAQGTLIPGGDYAGSRPGSYILMMKTYFNYENDADASSGGYYSEYQKEFFCENWSSPNGYYQVQISHLMIMKDSVTASIWAAMDALLN